MMLRDTVLTGLQNLGRRKVRTALTSVGVFVGILTIVTMVSLGVGIQKQVTDTIVSLGLDTVFVGAKTERQPAGARNDYARVRPDVPITPATVGELQGLNGVRSVEVLLELPAAPDMTLTVEGHTFPIVLRELVPQERIFSARETMLAGKGLETTPEARGIVLSQRLAKGAGLPQSMWASITGKPATITITAPRGDKAQFKTVLLGVSSAFFGADLANADKLEIKKWWYNDPNILQSDGYAYAVVHTSSVTDATRIARDVETKGYRTLTLQGFLDQVNRIFSILQVMLSSVGLLALLVASVGIANTMIMSIYERTREIGILKAVGASNGEVLRMFMFEAGLIGLLGGIVGVLGGWLLGLLLNAIILQYLKSQAVPIDAPFFVVTWDLVAGALVFASLVGVVAGLYPAFRAARLDPLAALRHE